MNSGDECVWLFDNSAAAQQKLLIDGLRYSEADGRVLFRVRVVSTIEGERFTQEFFMQDGELKVYLEYEGFEPSWLETNKRGVRGQPVWNFKRLNPDNCSGSGYRWGDLQEKLRQILAFANSSEPAPTE